MTKRTALLSTFAALFFAIAMACGGGGSSSTEDDTPQDTGTVQTQSPGSTEVVLTDILLMRDYPEAPVGGTVNFIAFGQYDDGSISNVTEQCIWTSSDDFIAEVQDPGIATVLRAGVALITATIGNVSASMEVVGFEPQQESTTLVSITLIPQNPVVQHGDNVTFIALENYDDMLGTNYYNSEVHSPRQVLDISGIEKVAAGRYHFAALKDDGTVWTWGRENNNSQLGRSGTTNRPAKVKGLSNIVHIECSYYGGRAVDSDGHVYSWGEWGSGRLGPPDINNDVSVPTKISGLMGMTKIRQYESFGIAFGYYPPN
ncbi:MAG: hypothetical protein U5N86_04950 [Planctomycetota bacterium]|nr:hypothetical protein [Planctomycetota bacterium]